MSHSLLSDQEMLRSLAWTEGRLRFDNTPLTQAVDEFNQNNDIQIEIADPALGSRHVSGRYRANDLDAFLTSVQRMGNVYHEITTAPDGRTIVILYSEASNERHPTRPHS